MPCKGSILSKWLRRLHHYKMEINFAKNHQHDLPLHAELIRMRSERLRSYRTLPAIGLAIMIVGMAFFMPTP